MSFDVLEAIIPKDISICLVIQEISNQTTILLVMANAANSEP